ncbi:pantoate kinase [Archaeoglobus sp.]
MIFAPASITCIFSPQIFDDPKNSGSIGVGFTINLGVEARKGNRITINGEDWSFSTLDYVIESVELDGAEIKADLPFGCGFGMSGAAALTVAMLGDLPYIKAADLAHEAEVVNLTGLGDVVTQTFGGIVVRKNAACPSLASVERFCWDKTLDFLILGEISTKDVISDDLKRKRIGDAGKKWTKEFLKKPTFENLFFCSNKFAEETGLAELVGDVVEAVESSGGMAGMVMLGKAVFAWNGFDALKEFGEPFRAKIDSCGVRRAEDEG